MQEEPATDRLRLLVDRARAAPDRQGWWRRVVLRDGTIPALDADTPIRDTVRDPVQLDALVQESLIRLGAPLAGPGWRQRDTATVIDDIRSATGLDPAQPVSTAVVTQLMHPGRHLLPDPADARRVETVPAQLDQVAQQLLIARSQSDSPNTHGQYNNLTPEEEALAEILRAPATRVAQPVTVWRGETPQPANPAFTETTRNAAPGDVLTRTRRPLSASLSPTVAATFAGEEIREHPSPGQGWVLQISTWHAVTVGRGSEDGLHEQEVAVYAPTLRVDDVFEGIVGADQHLTRVHVIACHPVTHRTGNGDGPWLAHCS